MSETQKIDPFDITGLVDAAILVHDQGQVVHQALEPKDTVPQIAAVVEPEVQTSAEPLN